MISTTSTLIDVHPHPHVHHAHIDTVLYADTIDSLVEASRAARQCAHACLHDTSPPAGCVTACLDAADLCSAAANIVIRMAEPSAIIALLQACREMLMSGQEALREQCGHMRICAMCAEVFEQAEEQCLRFEVAVSRLDPPAPV